MCQRERRVSNSPGDDDFHRFILGTTTVAIFILSVGMAGVMASELDVQGGQAQGTSTLATPSSTSPTKNWNEEVMHTPTIKDVWGLTLFYESDSYSYDWNAVTSTASGITTTTYNIVSYYGQSHDIVDNLWHYSGGTPALKATYTAVINPGATNPVYSQVYQIQESFSSGWYIQTYSASYTIWLYGDTSFTQLDGSYSLTSSVNIPMTFAIDFPVDF